MKQGQTHIHIQNRQFHNFDGGRRCEPVFPILIIGRFVHWAGSLLHNYSRCYGGHVICYHEFVVDGHQHQTSNN